MIKINSSVKNVSVIIKCYNTFHIWKATFFIACIYGRNMLFHLAKIREFNICTIVWKSTIFMRKDRIPTLVKGIPVSLLMPYGRTFINLQILNQRLQKPFSVTNNICNYCSSCKKLSLWLTWYYRNIILQRINNVVVLCTRIVLLLESLLGWWVELRTILRHLNRQGLNRITWALLTVYNLQCIISALCHLTLGHISAYNMDNTILLYKYSRMKYQY